MLLCAMVKLPAEPSDPKLKQAMEEIKSVLKNYDIAGTAILQSQTHGEWLNEISPSWSCAKLEGEALQVKALAKDYPSIAARNEAIEVTVGMLCAFRDGSNKLRENMEAVLAMLSQKFEIEHVSRFDR